jgi:gluconate 5-dehydrogenase
VGRHNIRVNAIAPSFPLAARRSGHRTRRGQHQRAGPIRASARRELAGVAVFLMADASNHITGQVIMLDGGRSIVTGDW